MQIFHFELYFGLYTSKLKKKLKCMDVREKIMEVHEETPPKTICWQHTQSFITTVTQLF